MKPCKIWITGILTVALLSAGEVCSQQISNIRVTQEGDKVVILYDLSGEPGQTYDIEVSVSSDNGKSYPIKPKTITGDLIKVQPGNNKKLTWDVLKDTEKLTGAGFVFKLQIKNLFDFDIEMVLVESGTFEMGNEKWLSMSNEHPVHKVNLSTFYISKYEVTQAQWKAVMGSNPSKIKGENLPVDLVSWNEVKQFIQKINQLTGLNYRLPTEAEWEFAARGGNNSNGYTYSGSNTISDVAWYKGNSNGNIQPIGQKLPNELGIYDMSGNVYEWCEDWYSSEYYKSCININPKGPESGIYRVYRGGSWDLNTSDCRVTNRLSGRPGNKYIAVGFRLARSL